MAPVASSSCYVAAACCALHEVMGQRSLRMFNMRFFLNLPGGSWKHDSPRLQTRFATSLTNSKSQCHNVSETTGAPSPTGPSPKFHCQNYLIIQFFGGPHSTPLQGSRESSGPPEEVASSPSESNKNLAGCR